LLIQHRAEVLRVHSKRGTENTHAALVLQLAIRLDRIPAEHRGLLMGYTGEEIDVTLRAQDIVDPAEPLPMERIWSSNGDAEERMRPGPTEACSECGKVIGDDPDADFYVPLAGPPRPVCGDCSTKLDDESIAVEAAATDADYDDQAAQDGEESEAASDSAASTEGEESAAPIGDGPLPERPAELEPVTTPTRRRR